MRILIVEDNRTTADYLSQGLKENYFIPEVAYDGQEGLFLATHNDYAVIILDVMLPLIDGWTLIKKIRENNPHTPVLFLTAKDVVDDRVKGLELGADDYLVKPFAFSELLARIRSLLRRQQPHAPDTLQGADLKIDMQAHKAMRGGNYINLTAKEFMLLSLLINRTGEVLSRTYIAEKVWDINFDSDTNAIDVAINRLREKMDKKYDQKLIHSVRGVGYVLEAR
jgi:two-component system copper resistance phosphate regulon response regulator CusR